MPQFFSKSFNICHKCHSVNVLIFEKLFTALLHAIYTLQVGTVIIHTLSIRANIRSGTFREKALSRLIRVARLEVKSII